MRLTTIKQCALACRPQKLSSTLTLVTCSPQRNKTPNSKAQVVKALPIAPSHQSNRSRAMAKNGEIQIKIQTLKREHTMNTTRHQAETVKTLGEKKNKNPQNEEKTHPLKTSKNQQDLKFYT